MTELRATPPETPATRPTSACDLLVVIINYRTPDLTIQCLKSLEPQVRDVPGTFVVVTDNNSADDSVIRIQQAIQTNAWERWCRLVPLPRNGGFAYGNNRGIDAGPKSRYILLLNSDTLVGDGCFRRCIEVMDAQPDIGAMSCRLLNADGTIQNACRRFPTPWRVISCTLGLPFRVPSLFGRDDMEDPAWDRATTARDVDWLGGAFLFLRADAVERFGGLSEDFFFYGEDIEMNHRLMKAGFRRHYDPKSSTTHLGGASSDPSRMPKLAQSRHHWRGRYLVQKKCYGSPAMLAVRAVDILVHASRACWYRIRVGRESLAFQWHRGVIRTICRPLMRPE